MSLYNTHNFCNFNIFSIINNFHVKWVTNYQDVCYVKAEKGENDDEELVVNKKLIDIIATSILLTINIYCIIHTLVYLLQQKRFENK